jgi:hypothetical protein
VPKLGTPIWAPRRVPKLGSCLQITAFARREPNLALHRISAGRASQRDGAPEEGEAPRKVEIMKGVTLAVKFTSVIG